MPRWYTSGYQQFSSMLQAPEYGLLDKVMYPLTGFMVVD
jgi:hypothetical protein